ncbi:hypothetical protein RSOL_128010 [Rhizoctonia solani AG-3 Rhs1AP]|uniref:Uncharacterized protein n=2 Tax=Rhizoctonia solani AG-3 TaxID=1086053 RepID=A0A074SYD7_9AGAM|nr:hypothetical protein RSOL_128010 [Rhizoctonia solani AG-3 Rhs1AP]KEP54847.1 hypothetical protein V565_012250 [Rhizoctonia solani 123E]
MSRKMTSRSLVVVGCNVRLFKLDNSTPAHGMSSGTIESPNSSTRNRGLDVMIRAKQRSVIEVLHSLKSPRLSSTSPEYALLVQGGNRSCSLRTVTLSQIS